MKGPRYYLASEARCVWQMARAIVAWLMVPPALVLLLWAWIVEG